IEQAELDNELGLLDDERLYPVWIFGSNCLPCQLLESGQPGTAGLVAFACLAQSVKGGLGYSLGRGEGFSQLQSTEVLGVCIGFGEFVEQLVTDRYELILVTGDLTGKLRVTLHQAAQSTGRLVWDGQTVDNFTFVRDKDATLYL